MPFQFVSRKRNIPKKRCEGVCGRRKINPRQSAAIKQTTLFLLSSFSSPTFMLLSVKESEIDGLNRIFSLPAFLLQISRKNDKTFHLHFHVNARHFNRKHAKFDFFICTAFGGDEAPTESEWLKQLQINLFTVHIIHSQCISAEIFASFHCCFLKRFDGRENFSAY